MAMVESRILAPVVIRRMVNDPNIERLRVTPKTAAVVKAVDKDVSISGKGLLLQRLGSKDNTAVKDPGNKQPIDYLTSTDRHLIGDVYEYARDKGASLKNVDDLATQLARYRKQLAVPDATNIKAEHPGSFSEQERAAVDRILNSNALSTTRLDQGFVRYMTDKANPRGDTNLEFIEQVVQQFSIKPKG